MICIYYDATKSLEKEAIHQTTLELFQGLKIEEFLTTWCELHKDERIAPSSEKCKETPKLGREEKSGLLTETIFEG